MKINQNIDKIPEEEEKGDEGEQGGDGGQGGQSLNIDTILKEGEKSRQGEGEGEGEQGGQTGRIRFRYYDPLSEEKIDDTLLSPEEKRLFAVHDVLHKEHVTKQKRTRQGRLIKERPGSTPLSRRDHRRGRMVSPYKIHPTIAKKFSGRDPNVSVLPSENVAETNLDKKHELENRLENKNQLRFVPSLNIKPKPP